MLPRLWLVPPIATDPFVKTWALPAGGWTSMLQVPASRRPEKLPEASASIASVEGPSRLKRAPPIPTEGVMASTTRPVTLVPAVSARLSVVGEDVRPAVAAEPANPDAVGGKAYTA